MLSHLEAIQVPGAESMCCPPLGQKAPTSGRHPSLSRGREVVFFGNGGILGPCISHLDVLRSLEEGTRDGEGSLSPVPLDDS